MGAGSGREGAYASGQNLAASLDLLPGCIRYLQKHGVQPRYVESSTINNDPGQSLFKPFRGLAHKPCLVILLYAEAAEAI